MDLTKTLTGIWIYVIRYMSLRSSREGRNRSGTANHLLLYIDLHEYSPYYTKLLQNLGGIGHMITLHCDGFHNNVNGHMDICYTLRVTEEYTRRTKLVWHC